IRRYDGFIEKFIGDAIMAVFGAPVAHEDDPERAVRAALGMQTQLQQLRTSAGGVTGGALVMRIGINNGLVVAGTVGEGKDYGVVGDTVNVAARLQQIGAPGKVTVSEETYRLIRKGFECQPLGPVTLKGKAEPIQAFEVIGPRREQSAAIEAEWPISPLVGREEELRQLLEVFARAKKGRTQVMGLTGEAGIGKSRLLAEFLRRLDEEGLLAQTTVYQAACPALGSEAYHIFIDFFRACFSLTSEESATQARDKITTILEAIGAPTEPILPVVEHVLGFNERQVSLDKLDPEQLHRQLFLTVKEICQSQCRHRPVLLVVEDFQWTDAASVELLRALVERISDGPLMLLLVSRPTPQMEKIYGVNVDSTVIRMQLLSPQDSGVLVEALIGPMAAPSLSVLRDFVASRAAGNPFFLEEALRSLIDAGILVKAPEGASLTRDLTALEVPTTVQGIILSRIDALEPGAKHLLQEGAVIGPSVSLELLRQITTQSQGLQAHLESLLRADLLAEVPGAVGRASEYRFRNSLIQEVAYNSLLRKRRTTLHGQIASSIERLHAHHLDEVLPQLAHHYSLSDDWGRALQYLLRFGDKATSIYANQDAVGCYGRALEILEQEGDQPALKAKVLEKLADAHNALGEPHVALRHWQAVLAHYEALGEKGSLASVHRKIGLAWWNRGDPEKALQCFRQGLDLLAGEPEDVETALLYHELGRLHFRIGDDERATDWSQKALDLGGRLEAAEVVSQASNTLGVSMARRGMLDE
ncbi:MAG: AAA family ATPase, partial [Dehalococcoidia bacterium]